MDQVPVFHLLSSDVVRDGMALFDVVSKMIEVLYLVVAHGYVGFFAMEDCVEGSGKTSDVESSSASAGIISRADDILFLDPGVLEVGGCRVAW